MTERKRQKLSFLSVSISLLSQPFHHNLSIANLPEYFFSFCIYSPFSLNHSHPLCMYCVQLYYVYNLRIANLPEYFFSFCIYSPFSLNHSHPLCMYCVQLYYVYNLRIANLPEYFFLTFLCYITVYNQINLTL